MNGDTTQDLGQYAPSTSYRYIVRHIGTRGGRYSPLTHEAVGQEYGAECVDSWTGDVMTVHWAGSAQLSSLVAETQCAERNAPATAITFPSKLALFTQRARAEGMPPGEILEDVDRILEWHLGRLRGLTTEPLDQTGLYFQAPDFNE